MEHTHTWVCIKAKQAKVPTLFSLPHFLRCRFPIPPFMCFLCKPCCMAPLCWLTILCLSGITVKSQKGASILWELTLPGYQCIFIFASCGYFLLLHRIGQIKDGAEYFLDVHWNYNLEMIEAGGCWPQIGSHSLPILRTDPLRPKPCGAKPEMSRAFSIPGKWTGCVFSPNGVSVTQVTN